MTIRDIEMTPLARNELSNPTMQAIVDAPNRESRACKAAKMVGLVAIPVIAGTVSLLTRLSQCEGMSNDECSDAHPYLYPERWLRVFMQLV